MRSGHGIAEIVILRQDFKMLNYLIELYNTKENELQIWAKLIKLFTSKLNDISASAGRCLESITNMNCYQKDEYEQSMCISNCSSLIENNIYHSLSKVLIESTKDTVLSSFIILLNMIDYGTYTKLNENLKIFLKEDGYVCLINLVSRIDKMDDDLIQLMSKLLGKLSDCKEKCEYFSHKQFKDSLKHLFDALIKSLEKMNNKAVLISFTTFISNLLQHNTQMDIDLNNLKFLARLIMSYLNSYQSDEGLIASLLRLVALLAKFSNEIQSLLIELGFSTLLISSLKSDSENLKTLAMECIIQCCQSNKSVQKAFFKQKVDDLLLFFLSKYLERLMKTLAMTAVWAIAGDDSLQRKAVCKKFNLELLNECISDQEGDLYVISCCALVVLFEQPPNMRDSTHDRFFKIDMVAVKLVRILSNETATNVLAVLRCIKKICCTCGENG